MSNQEIINKLYELWDDESVSVADFMAALGDVEVSKLDACSDAAVALRLLDETAVVFQ